MQEESKEIQAEQESLGEPTLTPNGAEPSLQGDADVDQAPVSEDGEQACAEPVSAVSQEDVAVDAPTEPDQATQTDAAEAFTTPKTAARSGIVISKTTMIIGAVAIVLGLVAAIALGMWISNRNSDPWRIESGLIDYGGFASDAASADQIVIPGYGEILLEADTRDVMLILPNYASNPCYFRFSILLKDSGEVIYTSGLVPPGKATQELTLKRAVSSGNYPAIIQIETFSLDKSHTPMNGANVETVLNFR